jgi:hypothetical protein
MPLHDFLCQNDECGQQQTNVYIPMDEIDDLMPLTCGECGGNVDFDFRNRTRSKHTRSHKFKEFTLHHTRRLDGSREGREIHSLADIRAFEKEHQDEQVCVEAFSYDSQQHIPDPVSADKPVTMTEDQKQAFAEKFRAMDIKDERSARDY